MAHKNSSNGNEYGPRVGGEEWWGSVTDNITTYMSCAAFLEKRQNPLVMEGRYPQDDWVNLGSYISPSEISRLSHLEAFVGAPDSGVIERNTEA